MNDSLALFLKQIGATLVLGAVAGVVLPRRLLRVLFVIATRWLAPAFFILLLYDQSVGAALVVFVAALVGAVFMTAALLAMSWRAAPLVGTTPSTRQDVVFYAISSVLWFALLYWIGSRADIGIFRFEVAQRFVPLPTDPALLSTTAGCLPGFPEVRCLDRAIPLDIWSALQLSGGNFLTLGAAGISPLDTLTRAVMTVQLVPLFVSAFVLSRD
jgi:hypothetical protein